VFDAKTLARSGSLAIRFTEDGTIEIETARDRAGARLWNDRSVREDQ
jgi:hypothetical protein